VRGNIHHTQVKPYSENNQVSSTSVSSNESDKSLAQRRQSTVGFSRGISSFGSRPGRPNSAVDESGVSALQEKLEEESKARQSLGQIVSELTVKLSEEEALIANLLQRVALLEQLRQN